MTDLQQLIDSVPWKEAKTYKDFAPHEYILRTDCSDVWEEIAKAIDIGGIMESFQMGGMPRPVWYRYYRLGRYKYWHYELVLNRALLDEDVMDIPE